MMGEGRLMGKVALLILAVITITASALTLAGCGKTAIPVSPKDRTGTPAQPGKKAEPEGNGKAVTTETPDSTKTPSPPGEMPIAPGTTTTDTTANQSNPSIENTSTVASTEPTAAPQRVLRMGLQGEDVKYLQSKLISLGYSPGTVDGRYNMHTYHAVVAFQKVNGLSRDGIAGPKTLQALRNPKRISARYSGSHIEVSKAHQVLLVVKNSKVEKILNSSTGRRGYTTPSVKSAVDWKAGYKHVSRKYGGTMIWSSFFYGGIAVHGFSSVPPYPASHGCVRVPIPDAKYVYDNMPVGSMVYVY